MVPKIISKGTSFKGAAAYLLHDKDRASSSERVAWTDTRNLAVNDSEMGWRIMAATAMDQYRLKEQAGIKSTGRRSSKAVLHLSLSWHPDEKDGLSREEMRKAAIAALKAIGADGRQALIIAHQDEPHPHLHILCNRVSPEDGRMLSSSNDQLKLSQWAENYEKERGQIYCEDRVVNNERRREGEYVRGGKNEARHIHDAVNDNARGVATLLDSQRALDHALNERGRDLNKKHEADWHSLVDAHKIKQAAVNADALKRLSAAKRRIGDTYHPKRRELNKQHHWALQSFESQEKRLLGRFKNAYEALNMRGRLRGDEHGSAIGNTFKLIASSGARRSALLQMQAQEKIALSRTQAAQVDEARIAIYVVAEAKIENAREDFMNKRAQLVDEQRADHKVLREAWRTRSAERRRAFEFAKAAPARKGTAKAQFEMAATPISSQGKGEAKQPSSGSGARTKSEAARKKAKEIKAKLRDRDGSERDR